MRIIFNLMNCGLGSNGGSQTIILSANTLSQLGHEVYIIDSGRHKYKWDEIEVPHIIVRKNRNVPDADVIIATGYKTIRATVNLPPRCGKKFTWLRAWETWMMPEKQIIEKVLKAPITHLVNSICLQNKLKSYGFESDIVRPGNSFELFNPPKQNRESYDIVIGGLYHTKQNHRKRSNWIIEVVKELRKDNKAVKLQLMGAENFPGVANVPQRYSKSPNKKDKEILFQKCNIWLAPTESEGLHIVPQEAMLTECPVIGTSAPLSGMQDYLIHKETGLMSGNNLKSFINQVKILSKDKKLRKKLGKAGRKKIIKLGNRKDNMIKLIELLEAKI
jgi:glycosyltransferase involved in cell wall biosynthesis